MGVKLGRNAHLYLDTGTYSAPTWSDVTNCKDVTLNGDPVEADVTTRGSGMKNTVVAINDPSVDFNMINITGDANLMVIRTAFVTGGTIYAAAMDDNILTSGAWGLEGLMVVTKFTNGQPLLEAHTYDVTLKPTLYPAQPAQWVTTP